MALKYKKTWIGCIAIFAVIAVVFMYRISNEAKLNVGRAYLLSYQAAENNYKANFGHYTPTGAELQNSVHIAPSDAQVYFDSASIPENVRKILPERFLPYVNKDAYQVVLTVHLKGASKMRVWRVSSTGEPSFEDFSVDF